MKSNLRGGASKPAFSAKGPKGPRSSMGPSASKGVGIMAQKAKKAGDTPGLQAATKATLNNATKATMTYHAPNPVEGNSATDRSQSPRRMTREHLAVKVMIAQSDPSADPKGHAREELQVREMMDKELGNSQWSCKMRGTKPATQALVDFHRNSASQLDEMTGRVKDKNTKEDAKSTVVGTSINQKGDRLGLGRSGSLHDVKKQQEAGVAVPFASKLSKIPESQPTPDNSMSNFQLEDTPVTIGAKNETLQVCAAPRAQSAAHDDAPVDRREHASTDGQILENVRDKPKMKWSDGLVKGAKTLTTSRGEQMTFVQSCNTCVGEQQKQEKQKTQTTHKGGAVNQPFSAKGAGRHPSGVVGAPGASVSKDKPTVADGGGKPPTIPVH